MKTVNSLSGGKTSSYLAVHYPADYELFSLVCNDDVKCSHPDKKIMQYANDKLQKYCGHFGEFVGTPENYKTLNVIIDLEQKIGRDITWLRAESFDQLITERKALPNQNTRWCTTEMKLKPIFWFCYLYVGMHDMRIGFRHDEMERAERFTTSYKFKKSCNNYGQNRNRWEEMEWRSGQFPLIEDKINHLTVNRFWENSGFEFPLDSNCQMCFWKNEQQLRKNFEDAPNVMQWAKQMESNTKNRFRHKMNMSKIEKIGLQTDFMFGTGSGCQAGFCTD